jgi:CheY-like chemotaxis protein
MAYKKVILVDDDAFTNQLYKLMFEDMQIAEEVLTFCSGEEVLDYLWANNEEPGSEHEMNLLLLDLKMPGMDGFAFMEKLEKMPLKQRFKIAVVTSSINQDDIDRVNSFKVNGLIHKPFTKEKLTDLMAALT